jgi:glycosyltransferase involved in cell wall biosynthesis
MRILHVATRSQGRGAELVALELARALDPLGHENAVVALAPAFDGSALPELPALTNRRRLGPIAFVEMEHRLRRTIRNAPVDVVLAHGGTAAAIAAALPRRRRPLVVWQRILPFPPGLESSLRRYWWRAVARRTDAAVALTEDLREELDTLGFAQPIAVIPNFRGPERFVSVDREEAAKSLRDELGVDPDIALLGFAGHLIAQKQPELAIDVLARVLALGEQAHLVIAGDGPLRDDVECAIRRHGVQGQVSMLGHRHDMEHLLGGVDLLVLTSRSEGIPGILIEAQMAGCPVVTFPVGSVHEVVDDGRTGVILPRADTDLMAGEIARLLRDPGRLTALGAAGRAGADRFSTERAARAYDHFLGGLVAGREPAVDRAH